MIGWGLKLDFIGARPDGCHTCSYMGSQCEIIGWKVQGRCGRILSDMNFSSLDNKNAENSNSFWCNRWFAFDNLKIAFVPFAVSGVIQLYRPAIIFVQQVNKMTANATYRLFCYKFLFCLNN
ncbi:MULTISPECIES: hypothetical protein [Bacillus amyloliquefaciens group]|uniref:hypothetical protein n=1 Tax=Bacillus amyloliquefaciens group TaxID=1938374 RepID=UPI001F47A92F|nr:MULTISPECIES: hypothetical protein [Bacillus amyloliquefaciens group]MDQ8091438.1 hypothetical protein [Bacillus amyloliquefaciens]